ncbi:acetyl-CoA hydrolase/transferase family protein [Desulfocurvus sp. DL9XJH121]
MSIRSMYAGKLTSANRAVQAVKSGHWVDYGFCHAQPVALDEALAARRDELHSVAIRGGMRLAPLKVIEADRGAGSHFSYASWHLSALERRLCDQGLITHIPMVYRNMPRLYRGHLHVDVAMFRASPMDDDGYFNLSLTNSAARAVVERAGTVIVEVNENLPPVVRGSAHRVHISEVTHVVEGPDDELPEVLPARPTLLDEKIALQILERIRDGATIQLGVGALPNAVGGLIADSDLRNLGMHTEMLVDGYLAMARAGKLNNSRKAVDRGLGVFTFCAGSRELYDWVRDNDTLASHPVDYTNDPLVIGRHPHMVSINSCVECDVLGQVTAETSGSRQISGTGGQLDFVSGGFLSPGGQSFVCCPSAYKDGRGQVHSRIRLALPQSAVVTDPRSEVHCLVTEWGVAELAGRSVWERAERIIGIAHPDFRERLFQGAEALGFWKRSNKIGGSSAERRFAHRTSARATAMAAGGI